MTEPIHYSTLDSLYRDIQYNGMTDYKLELVNRWHELGVVGREQEYRKALREYDEACAREEVDEYVRDWSSL